MFCVPTGSSASAPAAASRWRDPHDGWAGHGRGEAGKAGAPPPVEAPAPGGAPADDVLLGGVAAAMALVRAHRTQGHLAARLDPLGSEPPGDPALDPSRLI